jgi:hypothetical protein
MSFRAASMNFKNAGNDVSLYGGEYFRGNVEQ